MSFCDNCGYSLPESAAYCPFCGAPVKKKTEVSVAPTREPIGRILQAGLLGTFLSIMISSFSGGLQLYFIPSFISSLIVIYLFKARRLDEAIAIALAVYFFTNAVATVINYGILYMSNESPLTNPDFREVLAEVPTLLDVVMYAAEPVTAVAAGYIGFRLTSPRQGGKQPPATHRREEEPGGIIYSLRREPEKTSASTPHNV